MSTLKDQLIKLGFNPTTDASEPAWGKGHRGSTQRTESTRRTQEQGEGRPKRTPSRQNNLKERFDIPSDPQERALRIKSLIKKHRQPLPSPGSKRFYFQLGTEIDFIEVDHAGFERLVQGDLGVTLDESGRVVALMGVVLRELNALRNAR